MTQLYLLGPASGHGLAEYGPTERLLFIGCKANRCPQTQTGDQFRGASA